MSEFKGTKGKWKYDKLDVYSELKNEVIEGNIICIAPEGFDFSMVNWKSNAKLIAAAPEMLEMLEKLSKQIENEHVSDYFLELKDNADDLINKATKL